MTIAAANRRDNPETLFATPEIVADRRADGSIWLKSTTPLQPGARCVGDWLEHWARQTPDRNFLGERSDVDAPWTTVTYKNALRQVRAGAARAFARRFAARPGMNGKMPSGNQAGVYASTLAYLNAVAATGSDDAKDAVPQMKKFKGKDKLFGDVTIRQDGRVIHPIYLFEIKKPEESKYPYDYYKLVSTIPADQAFRPMADGGCSLVK